MSEKRKDHRGRVLKKGESQRKDRTYNIVIQTPSASADTFMQIRCRNCVKRKPRSSEIWPTAFALWTGK